MSHRHDDKQARRAQRLAHEESQRRSDVRQRLARHAGFVAVAAIAAVLITFAVVGRDAGKMPADHVTASAGNGAEVGSPAPAFALADVVSGRQVTAASLRGNKTMLFFSEGVNCQACMVQAADLERSRALRKAGIRLVSISTDPPTQLAQAARQYGIHEPLLADPNTQMSSAYGMLGHGGMGHPTQDGHAFILLGADGKVLWHQAYQEMYVKPGQLLADMQAATA